MNHLANTEISTLMWIVGIPAVLALLGCCIGHFLAWREERRQEREHREIQAIFDRKKILPTEFFLD